MKTLMVSEGNITYNGRLIELYDSMKKISDVTLISIANSIEEKIDDNHYVIKKRNSKIKKIVYMIKTFKKALRTEFDVLFIDNTEACMVGRILIMFLRPSKVIINSSELYLRGDTFSWKMKVLTYFEREVIKKADIHICANKYRAELMRKIYNLKRTPIVFENIRLINELPEVDNKYSAQLSKSGITRILSTGGLIMERAWMIIEAMAELGEGYELYILGRGSQLDINKMKQMIEDMNLKNVFFVGPTNRSVMRYFIQKCDIGVVYYSGKNINEKLCASGKIYEYMQEKKPFIGPKLMPLDDLCKEYGVGECDSSLSKAILRVKENYRQYQENVERYMSRIDVDENNCMLAKEIKTNL